MSHRDTSSTTTEDESKASRVDELQGVPALVWGFPDFARSVVWLSGEEIVVGRDADTNVQLESKSLSRRHARFRPMGKFWMVEDLASKNGVFVNGQRVEQTVLSPGDVIRMGDWISVFTHVQRSADPPFECLDGSLFAGPETRRVLTRARVLAKGALSLLILGETGTGKELLARAVHQASGRTGPFVAVNCATLRGSMAGAELFGYRRGAFTGAERAHAGYVASADGGTLFLDEVCELDPAVQAQLLRTLQEGEVVPLGEARPRHVDVHFVAAAQVPLAREVSAGRFRADLRARLEGAVLELPPLRARREEIAPLFCWLLARELDGGEPRVDPKLIERLVTYDWPLNVRELTLLVRKFALLHRAGAALTLDGLASELPSPSVGSNEGSDSCVEMRRAHEHEAMDGLLEALRKHGGNISRAAADLNISRQRAYRLLKQRDNGAS